MGTFTVKLNFWTTPTEIEANSNREAERLALELFPTCDCGCNEKTKVEWSALDIHSEEWRDNVRQGRELPPDWEPEAVTV